jgi:FkbH-like protein
LGGLDPAGEAYQAFQRELLALARRGVLLAVASKNDEALALSAIDRHPEMLIRREHLAGWVIDWEGKAANVRALCRRVGIALQDAVLIDDNPVERAAARAALPELTVPEWPANPMLYVNALRGLSIFDVPDITDEDLARARTYVAARTVHESPAAIETRIEVSKARPDDMVRVLQLLNKTNQVNLATRRFADGELTAWLAGGRRDLWTFRLADRFADYGIVGVLSLEFRGGACTIVDFVMSCRVMSRGVEERMLQTARQEARANGCDIIEAQFVPTERNEPMRRFLTERSGLATQDGSHFFTTAGEPLQTTA